jgi:hypothetical protein
VEGNYRQKGSLCQEKLPVFGIFFIKKTKKAHIFDKIKE